jgi:hypothetical protein
MYGLIQYIIVWFQVLKMEGKDMRKENRRTTVEEREVSCLSIKRRETGVLGDGIGQLSYWVSLKAGKFLGNWK